MLESLVIDAQGGSRDALEKIVTLIKDDVYYLSLRMMANSEDAKEATQEIMIKVITKLSTFRNESKFKTWVYRIAANYLLNNLKAKKREQTFTFDEYRRDLESDLDNSGELHDHIDYPLMLNEVRIACTMAMLLCLDYKHRLAYILGDILELNSTEASLILEVNKDAFRKQLSRAREKVTSFTSRSCGIVNPKAMCSCDKKIKCALKKNRINLNELYLSRDSEHSFSEAFEMINKINILKDELRSSQLQKLVPSKSPDFNLLAKVKLIF